MNDEVWRKNMVVIMEVIAVQEASFFSFVNNSCHQVCCLRWSINNSRILTLDGLLMLSNPCVKLLINLPHDVQSLNHKLINARYHYPTHLPLPTTLYKCIVLPSSKGLS